MIIGENIKLTTITKNDLSDYFLMTKNTQISGRFSPVHFASQMILEKQFNKDGLLSERFIVLLIKTNKNEIVGTINIRKWHPILDSYEIGFIVKPKQRGKGYATNAITLVNKYMFNSKPINLLIALSHSENIPSRKVLEKSGFSMLTKLPASCFWNGKYADFILHYITRDKFIEMDLEE